MNHARDDRLLQELARALDEADPVPTDVLDAAKASFTWRTIDAELAALEFDSAVDAVAGVRGAGAQRQLRFRRGDVEVELIVEEAAPTRIAGQISPEQHALVELSAGGTMTTVETDAYGSFEITDVPAGPISLRCVFDDGSAMTTEWTLL